MMHSPWQARIVIVAAICLASIIISRPVASPGHAAATRPANRYEQQLRSECELLIRDAVRRSYGIGWDVVPPPVERPGRPTTRVVSMQPLHSPAAGLILLYAGEFLSDDQLRQAGVSAARGVAASIRQPGNVAARPVFGPTAGGRDEPAYIVDRGSTIAGLSLLIEATDAASTPEEKELLKRAAIRCARWLMEQQARNGAWNSTYPEGALPPDASPVVKLDSPDFRDSTLALVLADLALSDRNARLKARSSVDFLISLRLGYGQKSRRLWTSYYTPAGEPAERLKEFRISADSLSSRYALQALLAAYVLWTDRSVGVALDDSAQALARAKREDGMWSRFVDTAPEPPATRGAFDPPLEESAPDVAQLWAQGDFGIASLVFSVEQLKASGRERYLEMLNANYPPRRSIAMTLVGLSDAPLAGDLPVTRDEIITYISRNAELWRALDGNVPTDLASRTRRLALLHFRAHLERRLVELSDPGR